VRVIKSKIKKLVSNYEMHIRAQRAQGILAQGSALGMGWEESGRLKACGIKKEESPGTIVCGRPSACIRVGWILPRAMP